MLPILGLVGSMTGTRAGYGTGYGYDNAQGPMLRVTSMMPTCGACFGGGCAFCITMMVFIWYIVDITLFSVNAIDDGNGKELYPM